MTSLGLITEPVSGHTDLVVPDEGGDAAPRVALPRARAHQLVQAHRARQILKRAFYQNEDVFSSMSTLSIFPSPLSTSMAWSPGAIT